MKKGDIIIQGKTKAVFEIEDDPHRVLIEGKDSITAFDGERSHVIEGKAAISNDTNAKIFNLLNAAGIKTSFIKKHDENSYIAKKCHMLPIEWVTRRVATGSFLKRNPGVKEGYRFTPVKLETFLKDDTNKDPQISEEQILERELNWLAIRKVEYDIMARTSVTVFEVLEKAWASLECALIDMKIEFGVDSETNDILVSDVIDSDSWRLWPNGDKRLMKDKDVYRKLTKVTEDDLYTVKINFEWVARKLDHLSTKQKELAVIVMGSSADQDFSKIIFEECSKLGVKAEMRISSAHKGTKQTLELIAWYEGLQVPIVFIAVAGRSNGLGPVLAANSTFPVINCPPSKGEEISKDIWSSLRVPSGLACTTVLYPEAAAQAAASIFALTNPDIWCKIRVKQLNLWKKLMKDDQIIAPE